MKKKSFLLNISSYRTYVRMYVHTNNRFSIISTKVDQIDVSEKNIQFDLSYVRVSGTYVLIVLSNMITNRITYVRSYFDFHQSKERDLDILILFFFLISLKSIWFWNNILSSILPVMQIFFLLFVFIKKEADFKL